MIDAEDHTAPNPVAGFDFRVVKPTLEQKCWMIDSILQHYETAASCAKKYHINRKSLNKLVRRRLQGHPTCLKSGRPRVLDQISIDSIDATIRENSDTTVDLLKGSISEEFKASYTRRYPDKPTEVENGVAPVKISRRSLKRYFGSFEASLHHTSNIATAESIDIPDILPYPN
jgi:hypothetical protein